MPPEVISAQVKELGVTESEAMPEQSSDDPLSMSVASSVPFPLMSS